MGERKGYKFFRISGTYGLETPNSGRIGAVLAGRRGVEWGEEGVQILPHFGRVRAGNAK